MTTHVEKALPEPTSEPVPASPSKTQGFNQEMLSPVSKLELARKFAAEEQNKRVSAACERMVVVKKAQIVKKMEVEASLDSYIEKTSHDHDGEDETKRSGRLSSIAKRLVGAFKTANDENSSSVANHTDDAEDATSPTRQLLRATRNKLNDLAAKQDAEDDDNLPATNYHLKQLGLANDKINIYAPLHEQQNELRRRRESAIRCQEKYMQENAEYPADEGYKSAEDSDYAPEEDDEEEDDDSDSDNDGEDDLAVDEDEVRRLLEDQSEFSQSVATIKKHKKQTKKANKAARVISPVSIIGAILVLVLALVIALLFTDHQSGFCRELLTQDPRAEDARIAACNVVLQLHEVFAHIVGVLPFRG